MAKHIRDILIGKRALLVHFAATPPMPREAGSNPSYPDQLRKLLDGDFDSSQGLCCCTITPGDVFPLSRNAQAVGCVGIVIDCESEEFILNVRNCDAGTPWVPPSASRLTLDEIEDTLNSRLEGQYNEWVINQLNIVGIFISPPPAFVPSKVSSDDLDIGDFGSVDINGFLEIDIQQVILDLPHAHYYSHLDDMIVEYVGSNWVPVNIDKIYISN